MEYKNARFTANGDIDCRINHPIHGWISFTVIHGDTGSDIDVNALYARIIEDNNILDYVPPDPAQVTTANINAERDRRTSEPFTFQGKLYDADPTSLSRISGASLLALGAMVTGKRAGDLRWHGGSSDFVWISYDNSLTPMDAPTCFAFGQAAAEWVSKHVFYAKALRSMEPLPEDYTDDKYWP
jgi:hypothetical protein